MAAPKNVSKIVAVLRNYVAHAKELNNPLPPKPIFFLKPPSSMIGEGNPIVIPPCTDNLHHEVELGVVIGQRCKAVKPEAAMDAIAGFHLCLDMTARDIQDVAKKNSMPWTEAKGYDTFCPISPFIDRTKIPNPEDVELWLKVNGEERQRASTNLMIFPIAQQIASASRIMTLEEGDLVLTGTPAGVGPVKSGDLIEAGISGVLDMKFDVVQGTEE